MEPFKPAREVGMLRQTCEQQLQLLGEAYRLNVSEMLIFGGSNLSLPKHELGLGTAGS
jgi:hypothetical protein